MTEAVIVGGGIGGVATALALAAQGWRVALLEKAPEIAEVGAGLQVSPNGFKVLEALGVGDAVASKSYEPGEFAFRRGPSGAAVFSAPSKAYFRRTYGAPYLQIHRADLLEGLTAALRSRAPGAIRVGCEALDYEIVAGRPRLRLVGGEVLEPDLLIGADGVRSRIREVMLGPERARFTGNVAWRVVVDRAALGDVEVPPGPCVWAGPGRHAVTYPLRSGEIVNFVGVVERSDWRVESWSERAPAALAQADFRGWPPLIERILAQTQDLHRWALFDRAPSPRWTDGPAALLGDACHPMLPTLAQGACQALEDAWALARWVGAAKEGREDLATALRRYEAERKPRVTRIQRSARGMARLFHLREPWSTIAHAPLRLAGRAAPEALLGRNGWIYAHDATALKAPS